MVVLVLWISLTSPSTTPKDPQDAVRHLEGIEDQVSVKDRLATDQEQNNDSLHLQKFVSCSHGFAHVGQYALPQFDLFPLSNQEVQDNALLSLGLSPNGPTKCAFPKCMISPTGSLLDHAKSHCQSQCTL